MMDRPPASDRDDTPWHRDPCLLLAALPTLAWLALCALTLRAGR